MHALIEPGKRLLTFRAGGEEMPHAPRLLIVLLIATLTVDAITAAMLEDAGNSPLWIAVRLAIGQGLLWMLLQGAGKAPRFVQTAIALVFVALVLSLIMMPMVLMMWPPPKTPQEMTLTKALGALLLMPVFVWFLCLRAHILRGATEYRYLSAFLISLALLLAEASLTISLMKYFSPELLTKTP